MPLPPITEGTPFNYFQIYYDHKGTTTTNPGNPYSQCRVQLDFKYPKGWAFSILDVEIDGFADIADGHTGIFKENFKFDSEAGVSIKRKFKGP